MFTRDNHFGLRIAFAAVAAFLLAWKLWGRINLSSLETYLISGALGIFLGVSVNRINSGLPEGRWPWRQWIALILMVLFISALAQSYGAVRRERPLSWERYLASSLKIFLGAGAGLSYAHWRKKDSGEAPSE
jgi:hypothetical protein